MLSASNYSSNFKVTLPSCKPKYFKRFLRLLGSADLRQDPSPHIVFEDVFKPDHYDLFRASIFEASEMNPFSEGYKDRFVHHLNRKTFWNTEKDLRRHFWFDVVHELSGVSFNTAVHSKFAPFLHLNPFAEQERQANRPVKYASKTDLMKDANTYSLGPHTDHPDKFLTILFYLPDPQVGDLSGTSFFRLKEGKSAAPNDEHHSFDNFEHLFEVPFKANTALMFLRTADSFHGVRPAASGSGFRDLLIHNLHVLPGAS